MGSRNLIKNRGENKKILERNRFHGEFSNAEKIDHEIQDQVQRVAKAQLFFCWGKSQLINFDPADA